MPLGITNMQRAAFPKGHKTPDRVIVSHRYIRVLEGELDYCCDGVRTRVIGGQQVFVPAWSRRQWWAVGRMGCRLIWCEFVSEALILDFGGLFLRTKDTGGLEKEALERMLQSWPGKRLPYESTGLWDNVSGSPSAQVRLLLEGELKATLARFWQQAHLVAGMPPTPARSQQSVHPEVVASMDWLTRNYQKPDALELFYRRLLMSPNHFRVLLKKAKGETVQNLLLRLRMRHARCLAHETDRPLKQIAAEVGYANPLFFSRQYRKFWGHAPSLDRGFGLKSRDGVSGAGP